MLKRRESYKIGNIESLNLNLKESLMNTKVIIDSFNKKIFKNEEELNIPKQSITSYLLLLALSVHAFFEGIAIGLQETTTEIFYMFLAISFHKWVEALSIGINLNNSKIEKKYFIKFIILFSLMTPIGMVLGIIFSGFSKIVEAVFLSISAGNFIFIHKGSFIYISSSEIVIDEFSVSRYKIEKFIGFLAGAFLVSVLTFFGEHKH